MRLEGLESLRFRIVPRWTRILIKYRAQPLRDAGKVLHEVSVNVRRSEERAHLRCVTRERCVFERFRVLPGNSELARSNHVTHVIDVGFEDLASLQT